MIARYLENGSPSFCSVSPAIDVFTGEIIPGENIYREDGEYSWNHALSYYVRKYNLRLPKEFESHVLSRTGK